MQRNCPINGCQSSKIGLHGSYFRSSDSRRIPRFRCLTCLATFSAATESPCFRQKKRRINEPLFRLLASGVSQRRAARLLKIHRTTVARRLPFLADQARIQTESDLCQAPTQDLLYFDEMETFEHSKCKPLSIPLAVSKNRKILAIAVASMPCKGPLAEKARKKYGPRPDERKRVLRTLLADVRRLATKDCQVVSDENPRYPSLVRDIFPKADYEQVPGLRGCVTGQGELKAARYDPLFALNHTAAMIRDNVKRLARRTWCTTKKAEALADHLAIYARYHNTVLTA